MATQEQLHVLQSLTTATITTILLKQGIRNTWIRGSKPLVLGQQRVVGPAFTMRFVPMREDLATPESWTSPISTRHAIEDMSAGAIAVIDAMGFTDAGVFGDILCARMVNRGVRALVTDGAMRDVDGVEDTGLLVWCAGPAAPPSIAGLTFVGWQEPIACGGVAIFPDDIICADSDGCVVVPKALVDHVVELGPEQERLEGWLVGEVNNGAKLPGLYPPDEATRARYEAWKKGS